MASMLAKAAETTGLVDFGARPVVFQPRKVTNRSAVPLKIAVESSSSRHARAVSSSHCSTSAGFSVARPKSRRVPAGSAFSSSSGADETPRKTIVLRIKKLTNPNEANHSTSGRFSGTSIGSSADDQLRGEPEADASAFDNSSLSDFARPHPVVQGLADSPFVGEFAMDLTGGATGLTEYESMTAAIPLYQPRWIWFAKSAEEENLIIDRAINATIVGSAAVLAITKLLTVDRDYWHGWTLTEILQYAPKHSWFAYEELLKTQPVLAKMMISGTVYSIGDWIAQCVEGKSVLEFNRLRMLRSGLVGFCLHGSMSHFYYHFCEWLFPFQGWWVLPLKVGFDQTLWSGLWNSIYFATIGLLRLESPVSIFKELRQKFFPLLTAGWKLWPFAHLVTYGVIPVEQRLLWVDMVEILWVTILAMYSNENAEARIAEAEEVSVVVDLAAAAISVDEVVTKDI